MVNHYYFYCVDEDFGPFFLKFCSYFPQRQALHQRSRVSQTPACRTGRGVRGAGQRRQVLCRPRAAASALRWTVGGEDRSIVPQVARPPAASVSARDRAAGYRYQLSILQAEFSLTQVLDQPVTGRIFFEEVIRENLDLGRPDPVQLMFDRRVTRRTPGPFRTRVVTDGVIPSLHVVTRTPASSSTSRRAGRFEPKPRSTTPTTSPSADACKISRTCARSALRPTDVCSTFKASVTTAPSAKLPSRTCKDPSP